MKIAFIEPKPDSNLYFFLRKLPLLGNLFMAGLLREAGHEVRVFKEDLVPVYRRKSGSLHPFIREADAVGITAITHTVKRAYRIADGIKRLYPDKKIVMGGSHVSALPQEALQHVDQVVVGEGENVVRGVFEGTITDRIVQGTPADLDRIPPVDLHQLAGYRVRGGRPNMKHAPIMASRGCPHDCIFCAVTRMFGRKYRFRDPDLLLEEVMMRHREGFRLAFFYDDNFAAAPQKAKLFLEKLIRKNIDFRWSSQFSIHAAKDPELLRLLKRAGCIKLFVGVESINPQALKDYRKSQTVEMIEESIRAILDAGLGVHSMFVLGADSDDESTIDATIRFSRSSGSSTVQFSLLFPIPGTPLYEQMKREGRIFVDDWEYFDGSHSVILTKLIHPRVLQQKFIEAYKYFYGARPLHWIISRLGAAVWTIQSRPYLRLLAAQA
jgi:anaerobic magnesium-protoporphyrin IX monomethyl ester cyclase